MLTPEQLEARKGFIGSSDVAAVLGLSRPGWHNAEDVRLEKSGQLVGQDKSGDDALEGHCMEPGILTYMGIKLNVTIERGVYVVHPDLTTRMAANLDGWTVGDHIPTEAKRRIRGQQTAEVWGTAGSQVIPMDVAVQLHAQIACCPPPRPDHGLVGCDLNMRGVTIFMIPADDGIMAWIEDACRTFWTTHVLGGEPCPHVTPHMDIVRRIKRQPGKIVCVQADLCQELMRLRRAAIDADHAKEDMLRQVMGLAGDADAIRAGIDGPIVVQVKRTAKGNPRMTIADPQGSEEAT